MVRGAVLKVASRNGLPTTLQCPLQLLYPLEISSEPPATTTTTCAEPQEGASDEQSSHSDCTPEERNQAARSRPQRGAAIKARQFVQQCCILKILLTTSQWSTGRRMSETEPHFFAEHSLTIRSLIHLMYVIIILHYR